MYTAILAVSLSLNSVATIESPLAGATDSVSARVVAVDLEGGVAYTPNPDNWRTPRGPFPWWVKKGPRPDPWVTKFNVGSTVFRPGATMVGTRVIRRR